MSTLIYPNLIPGIQAERFSVEKRLIWGPIDWAITAQLILDSTTVDARSTPNTGLLPGLVLGKITSSGYYKHYLPTATDGSNVAQAILGHPVQMLDGTGTAQVQLALGVVAGPVKAGECGGLDNKVRQDLGDSIIWDDNFFGARGLYRRETAKTANYTVTAADNGTDFVANGAANIFFTLPTPAPGLYYRFRNLVGFNMTIVGNSNIVGPNNATATNLAYSSANNLIGAALEVFTNAAGTAWYVNTLSPSTLTVS